MNRQDQEAQAMMRFNILNLSRVAAIVFVVLGAVLISGKYFPDAPPALGYTVFVIGVIDFFMMPFILQKMWAQKDTAKPGLDQRDRSGDDLIP